MTALLSSSKACTLPSRLKSFFFQRHKRSLNWPGFLLLTILIHTSNPSFTQTTATPPNILVIVLDDARYDMFAANGGPAFFHTPAINRIAEEGVNFKYACATTALCTPSRASIYTGLYAHHHGAVENEISPIPGLTYVSEILQDAGYYTGFIGKWLLNYKVPDTPIGFDYWAVTDSFGHLKPLVKFNDGTTVQQSENDAIVFTDLAIDFLDNEVPAETPWLLFVCHRIPHTPYQPLPGESQIYQNSEIVFPDNFYPYEKDFPSYLYPTHKYEGDSAEVDQDIRDYYETCQGAEYSVNNLLNYLEGKNLLDSTLIIFTSDNGFLMGEHDLQKKLLSYDESIRLPLFIRYPAWFAAGTVVDDEFAANIDIAPTLLDAAGIPDTFNMDGVSLKKLANGETHRKYFFYENYPVTGTAWDAVRSFDYKYIYSYCSTLTEEFYDLTIDPKENTNRIFDPSYSAVIGEFRGRMNNLRLATGNTSFPDLGECHYEFTSYADFDSDGYGDADVNVQDDVIHPGYVLNKEDCNDANASVHPGAPDVCNSIDDNCDQVIDENAIAATVTPAGNVTVCDGSSIILTANGGAGISYQWFKNNHSISGATNQTYAAKKDAGFKVSETNTFGCASISAPTTVNVLASPVAEITPLGDLDICLTGSVMLEANSGGGYSYQWMKGANILSGQTNQTYTATSKGNYKVIVTSQNNCTKTSKGTKVINTCREGEEEIFIESPELSIYPNPAGDQATIHFILPQSSWVIIKVFDLSEKEIQTLLNEEITQGDHTLLLNTDHFSKGIYLVKMITGAEIENEKLIVQ